MESTRNEPIKQQLEQLQARAEELQKDSKYKECMDVYEDILNLKKNYYGEHSEEYHKSAHKLCELSNLVSIVLLKKEKFDLVHLFLKKAEALSLNSNHHKAITYNNFACYYRRIKKPRSALTYLQNALALELKLNKFQVLADTHLNLCAVHSELGRHSEALEHILMSIVMLQEELLLSDKPANPERLPILAIAYHNMGVQLEYLKRFDESLLAYKKAVKFGVEKIGEDSHLVENLRSVLQNAEETVSNLKKKKDVAKASTDKIQKIRGLYGQRPQTSKLNNRRSSDHRE